MRPCVLIVDHLAMEVKMCLVRVPHSITCNFRILRSEIQKHKLKLILHSQLTSYIYVIELGGHVFGYFKEAKNKTCPL